jgi:hypothetical protein
MTAVSTVLNFAALFLLTKAIFQGQAGTGRTLLLDAINIWATNVAIFALWFWTLDRGSPSSRGLVLPDRRDFLFTQQQQASDINPTFADWSPGFMDYVFLAYPLYSSIERLGVHLPFSHGLLPNSRSVQHRSNASGSAPSDRQRECGRCWATTYGSSD